MIMVAAPKWLLALSAILLIFLGIFFRDQPDFSRSFKFAVRFGSMLCGSALLSLVFSPKRLLTKG